MHFNFRDGRRMLQSHVNTQRRIAEAATRRHHTENVPGAFRGFCPNADAGPDRGPVALHSFQFQADPVVGKSGVLEQD